MISTVSTQSLPAVPEFRAASAGQSEPLRVLIVDENPDHAFLTVQALRRCDFRSLPVMAGDAAFCVAAVRQQPPNAIVMDCRLSDTDGLAVLSKLHDLAPHVPIIFATSEVSEDVAVAAMKLGAVDYVVKDGDYLQHLPETITLGIERLRQQEADPAAAGDSASSLLLDETTGVLSEDALIFFATILVAETGRRKASFGIILVQVDEPAIGASDELTAAPCSGWWPVH